MLTVFALLFVLSLVIVFGVFRVRKLVVTGNEQYQAEEIQEAVMKDGLCKNTLYFIWKFREQDKTEEEIPFLDELEVTLLTPYEVQIKVKEKQQIGYLLSRGSYIYFDKNGTVVSITDKVREDVPQITGLDVEKAELYEKLPVKDEGMYHTIVTLTKTLNKDELVPKEIRFNTNSTITLTFNSIKVNLGDDNHLEDKIAALYAIYEQLDGKSGTLYMESYAKGNEQVTFKSEDGDTEDLTGADESGNDETADGNLTEDGQSQPETQAGGGRMYAESDGTFSTDAEGNRIYTDAAGVTTNRCDSYNYTDENGNIIMDGYGYIDPYTGSYIN